MQAERVRPSATLEPAAGQSGSAPWSTSLLLRLFYFFFFGAVGCYLAFFAPYLRGLGFSGEQIGLVQMMSPVAGLIATLGWAALADRLRAATRALRLCTLLALASLLFLPWARTPLQVAAVLLVHNLAAPALVPLIDSVTFEWLKARRAGSYARIRLFGTLGGLILVQSLGLLLSARGDQPGDLAMPLGLLMCVAGYTAVAQMLPFAPPADRPPGPRDMLALGREGRLRLLLLICLLHWLCHAPYDLLFGVFLRDRGLPSSVNGLVIATGAVAEMLMLAAFPALERRVRASSLLALTFAAAALRWGLLSQATDPFSIAALQLLHGIMSGLFWATVVKTLGVIVPARLRVTGHALFGAVVVSGGNVLGYRLAGLGYDWLGGSGQLFAIASVLQLVPLALVLFLGRRLTHEDSP